ncbi:zinc-dependent metalloprotease [Halorubrum sp. F4]|uniref:zinc-dependent metalloprotease n=1 Tax=Halorubrum sp. F4 TaxID=2989715 RepID=UPI0024800922|nr:zinc-dependent metalloprotease [Halorubrum sp. F4]
MDILRSLRAVSEASGTGVVDWTKAGEAARASTEPGTLDLTPADRRGYATDVRDARDRLREVAGVDFAVPDAIEVQNRHHWIDANLETFRNVMGPIESAATPAMPGLSRVVNTGSMAFALGFLARNVLGQYDPLLLADEPDVDHGLYFVHPNVVAVAADLDVAYPRFRRWIAFHEVTHAAEFGAAPWLSGYLESRVERGIDGLSASGLDPDAFVELQTAMTAVEGYAELLMDRAFDDEYADLRRKVDERRGGGGPVTRIARRLLGLGLKRRQYERGAAFFERVADERGLAAASAVWERPEHLPTDGEIDDPAAWLARVDP